MPLPTVGADFQHEEISSQQMGITRPRPRNLPAKAWREKGGGGAGGINDSTISARRLTMRREARFYKKNFQARSGMSKC